MNKGDYNSEKLEAYIRNELSAGERSEFEQALRQDPLLHNELILQQDIIATIRDNRKNELKQRLNRIDVNGTNSGIGGFQIGSTLLSGLAVIGISGLLLTNHFYTTKENIPTTVAAVVQPMLSEADDEDTGTGALTDEVGHDSALNTTSTFPMESTVSKKAELQKRKLGTAKKKSTVVPVLPAENFAQESFKDENIKKEDIIVANDKVGLSTETVDSRLVILDNVNAKYNQHYKYSNGQLFLYGFSKPYKILDVKRSKQRYLFYDGSFYKLDRNQYQIAPVQKVTNQELIKELEILKEKML